MALSGIQIQTLLLLIGIGGSVTMCVFVLGFAWFFGFDLTGVFSKDQRKTDVT
jgi:hypothetical protein